MNQPTTHDLTFVASAQLQKCFSFFFSVSPRFLSSTLFFTHPLFLHPVFRNVCTQTGGGGLYLGFLPDECDAGIDEALEHVVQHLFVHVREGGRQLLQPRLHHRPPAQRLRLHVDHSAPGHLEQGRILFTVLGGGEGGVTEQEMGTPGTQNNTETIQGCWQRGVTGVRKGRTAQARGRGCFPVACGIQISYFFIQLIGSQ